MIYTTAAGVPHVQQGVMEDILRERESEGSSHSNGNGINESHMQRLSDDFAALMTCLASGRGGYMQRLRRV